MIFFYFFRATKSFPDILLQWVSHANLRKCCLLMLLAYSIIITDCNLIMACCYPI